MIATLTQNQWALIVAIILFGVAAIIRAVKAAMSRPWDSIFVAVGLAVFALAFLLTP